MDHSKKLGEKRIRSLLLEFSIPSIIGMLVNALYNVVDRIYVGHGVGTLAISALSIVFPIQLILFGFIMLVGVGGSALTSISLGQKNKERAEHILGNGFVLLILLGVGVLLLGLFFIKPLLSIAGTTSDNFGFAYDYLSIILFFIPFQFVGYGINNFIRSEGNPVRSMFSMVAGAVINIILDPIFIFGFKLGVKGAAIATGISIFVTAVWNVYYFTGGRSLLKLKFKQMQLDAAVTSAILKIGIAPFLMQVVQSFLNILMNNQIKNYGGELIATAQASIGIIQGFNMLFFMPVLGINMGAQPIIGYNYGAKRYDRVKKTLFASLLGAFILTTSCFIFSELIPGIIIRAFNNTDPHLIEFGSRVMRIVMMLFPVIGFYVVTTSYFQAIGKAKKSIFLGLARPLFFLVPLVILMPRFYGLNGVWYSIPLADTASTVLALFFMITEFKRLSDKHQKSLAG